MELTRKGYEDYLLSTIEYLHSKYKHNFNIKEFYHGENELYIHGEFWISCRLICDICDMILLIHTPIVDQSIRLKAFHNDFINYNNHKFITSSQLLDGYSGNILTCEEMIIKSIIE